jgi:hypothetical protein
LKELEKAKEVFMESWNSADPNKRTSGPLPHFTEEESKTQRVNE